MKLHYYYICALALFLIGGGEALQAQVTIGSDKAPAKGLLLQLKDKEPGTKNETASQGLVLPRVKLKEEEELKPFISSATEAQKIEHEGMLVYNLSDEDSFCPGLYVWNKEKWVALDRMSEWDRVTENLNKSTGTGTIKTQDGKIYSVGYYEDAGWWMTQNLATEVTGCKHLPVEERDGGSFTEPRIGYPQLYPGVPDEAPTKNRPADFDTNYPYGVLYNWSAATLGQNTSTDNQEMTTGLTDPPGSAEVESQTGHIQGVCPKGWHVPSYRDWKMLEAEVLRMPSNYAQGYSAADATNFGLLIGARGIANNSALSCSKPKDKRGFSLIYTGNAINGVMMGTSLSDTHKNAVWCWSSSRLYSEGYELWIYNTYGTIPHAYVLHNMPLNYLQSVRCKRDKDN